MKNKKNEVFMSLPHLKDCVLDHVAIAVRDLSEAQKIYEDIGFVFDPEREEVAEQKVLTSFAKIDQNAHLELLYPTSEESAINKFLEKKGPGIHHLCFRVDNLLKKMEELSSKGYEFIYQAPKKGAHHCLVNFLHPKSTGGVLIELSEPQNDDS